MREDSTLLTLGRVKLDDLTLFFPRVRLRWSAGDGSRSGMPVPVRSGSFTFKEALLDVLAAIVGSDEGWFDNGEVASFRSKPTTYNLQLLI